MKVVALYDIHGNFFALEAASRVDGLRQFGQAVSPFDSHAAPLAQGKPLR